MIKAKTRARESHRPVTPILNNIFLPCKRCEDPKVFKALCLRSERLPVFYPHSHGCSPLSIKSTDHISGANEVYTMYKNKSVQSPEKGLSQKNNRNKRKFRSFPHQISDLVSVKVRVVWYKIMIVFLLHFQAHFACEICAVARSLMEFVQAEVRHILFYDHKLEIPLQMLTHFIIN